MPIHFLREPALHLDLPPLASPAIWLQFKEAPFCALLEYQLRASQILFGPASV